MLQRTPARQSGTALRNGRDRVIAPAISQALRREAAPMSGKREKVEAPEIAPCPYCGMRAVMYESAVCWVSCTSCEARGPSTTTEAGARDYWNRVARLAHRPPVAGAARKGGK